MAGIDGDGQLDAVTEPLDDRYHPPRLFCGVHWIGARAARFAPDIEDIRAVLGQSERVFDRVVRIECSITRERIGRHINDSHDVGPTAPVRTKTRHRLTGAVELRMSA